MPNSRHYNRMLLTLRTITILLVSALAVTVLAAIPGRPANDEQVIWNLERDYWRYVVDNNLTAYRSLWHENFLGWPGVSATPVHKDHITDWITSQTSKGLAFHLVALKPASIQVTGDVALTYYWLTAQWQAKDGTGESRTTRVTHTWVRHGKDWLIIGGMSAPEPSAP
jgi:hypothetical protein